MILHVYKYILFILQSILAIFSFFQQIKRKIGDVSRKLEVLYDCLRESKVCTLFFVLCYNIKEKKYICIMYTLQLSQNTLQGLHQISQMIQSGNYTGGLDLHTQLVSGPDFSEISSFMPGIKVLLLSALQLNVYIRQNAIYKTRNISTYSFL